MKNILIHTYSDHPEYHGFIQSLYQNNNHDITNLLNTNTTGNLFEIYYQAKIEALIIPANEYNQEFHDFINEYSTKLLIVLFINTPIDNKDMLKFWTDKNILLVGSSKYLEHMNFNGNKSILYEHLYNHDIYHNLNKTRNEKTIVLLSKDDDKNMSLLKTLLYPNTKKHILLFNSSTFKHPQNVGFINAVDTNLVFNIYKSLIDIDDNYRLEAQACGIPNIIVDSNLAENLSLMKTKPVVDDIDSMSYNTFVKNTFFPELLRIL